MGCCLSKRQSQWDSVTRGNRNSAEMAFEHYLNGNATNTQRTGGATGTRRTGDVTNIQRTGDVTNNQRTGGNLSPRSARVPVNPGKKRVRALYNYMAILDDDLSFEMGDILEIDSSVTGNWPLAFHLRRKKSGYIPRNYICEDNDSLQSQAWWFNVDRIEAEVVLKNRMNKQGTFLVRPTTDGQCALSIRDKDGYNGCQQIRHYKIKQDVNGRYYILTTRTFISEIDLINSYKSNASDLQCSLTLPCSRVTPEHVPPLRLLEVEPRNVKMETQIGAGNFGNVYKGKLNNRLTVAVKCLKIEGSSNVLSFIEEAKIMQSMSHSKLVALLAVCSQTVPVLIITEFMENGNLHKYLTRNKSLDFCQLIDMAAQIADGMAYLEERKFVHRDLRAENVLLGRDLSLKVADFGLTKCMDVEQYYFIDKDSKFPIRWASPEVVDYQKFSVKSDVWSFGMVLYEIITFGKMPYKGMENHVVIEEIRKGKRLPKPTDVDCPQSYYDLILKCWKTHPAERPTFEYLRDIFADYFIYAEKCD